MFTGVIIAELGNNNYFSLQRSERRTSVEVPSPPSFKFLGVILKDIRVCSQLQTWFRQLLNMAHMTRNFLNLKISKYFRINFLLAPYPGLTDR